MTSSAHRDGILEALRISSRPLDDDQLSGRTAIRPRQQVNQLCRALERAGLIRRYSGPDGKIANELVREPGAVSDPDVEPASVSARTVERSPVDTAVERATDHNFPPGSSHEQREAERAMLDLLSEQLGVALEPARITVPSGARVEIDGADADRSVLVECWAHQGSPKAAQRNKVLSDALKLTWISSTIYPRPRAILCLSDPLAAAPFQPGGKSWAAQALQDLGIAVWLVELPVELVERVRAAQVRQYR